MRRLAKLPIPPVLATNKGSWLTEYLADPSSQTRRTKYRHPEIKATLRTETSWKCVYCESKIGHNTPGDVEHKVPSSRKQHLHFDWNNLTIACTECNRRKNDYYEQGEEFLDPYLEDVEACLVHLGPLVYWKPGHARAEVSVRTLELDSGKRPALLERKRDTLEKARALLDLVQGASTDLIRALRVNELDRMHRVDAEYSAMVLTYVTHVLAK
jgi:5-methylcytosine-specific restriction endonuclease McrA